MERTGGMMNRRQFLELLGAGAATALVGCSGEQATTNDTSDQVVDQPPAADTPTTTSETALPPQATTTEATAANATGSGQTYQRGLYVPVWVDQYRSEMASLPAQSFDRLFLAFCEPRSSEQQPANLNLDYKPSGRAYVDLIGRLATPSTLISLAIGGWGGSDEVHTDILRGFKHAANDPATFTKQVGELTKRIEGETGLVINGLDMDYEFPDAPKDINPIAESLKSAFPVKQLTVTVPSFIGDAYSNNDRLWQTADHVNIMTYDYDLDGNTVTQSLAPTGLAVDSIQRWVELIGDPQKLHVGLPAYAHRFVGATALGATYRSSNEVPFNQLDPAKLATIGAHDSQPHYIDGDSLVSVMPPRNLRETINQVITNHPNIGGFFYWSAEGMTAEHTSILP